MTKLASIVISGFALNVIVAPALAIPIVFAGFIPADSIPSFSLVSTDLGNDHFKDVITGTGPIDFSFMIAGTLVGGSALAATLSLTATSFLPGDCPPNPNCITTNGGPFTQSGYSGQFSITLNTPFNGSSNVLTGTFVDAQFDTFLGGSDGTLETTSTSSNPNHVAFTSDFLNFASSFTRNVTFNLTQFTPTFRVLTNTATDNRFPDNFAAMSSASFVADPSVGVVPEPSTFGLLASGLLGFCLWQRRRRPLRL